MRRDVERQGWRIGGQDARSRGKGPNRVRMSVQQACKANARWYSAGSLPENRNAGAELGLVSERGVC